MSAPLRTVLTSTYPRTVTFVAVPIMMNIMRGFTLGVDVLAGLVAVRSLDAALRRALLVRVVRSAMHSSSIVLARAIVLARR